MKRNLLSLLSFTLLVILNLISYGQDRKLDIIKKANGDSLTVFVINISEYDVTYSYPNEQPTYTVTKNIIKEIHFGSGRIEKISEPVIIKGENDWEKVKVTTVPSDIKGLTLKGEVKAKGSSGYGFKGADKADSEAMEKIKKQAAVIGAHIILLESKIITANNSVVSSGKAFGY